MIQRGSALRKRDIFSAPIFEGLTAAEHLRLLTEQIRRLPTKGLHPCTFESGCDTMITRGELCDLHRKFKNAAAAKLRYHLYGRPKKSARITESAE